MIIESIGCFTVLIRLAVQVTNDANDTSKDILLVETMKYQIQKDELYCYERVVNDVVHHLNLVHGVIACLKIRHCGLDIEQMPAVPDRLTDAYDFF